ncbi:MAG: hypothetical protein ROO76_10975 [Terriglobia bacterium]|jgi:hypothetical protein|nr:hypothetical protein [Terriglobia bacterium]
MQAVKDSFYMALRQRLAQSYPTRSMGDTNQPALIVCENVSQSWVPANDVFYLRWTSDEKLSPDASAAGWRAQQCEITYGTAGSESANGEDRGRSLAELDAELHSILEPRQTALLDYTQEPPAMLSGTVLWTHATLDDAKDTGGVIQRTARLSVLWQEAQ